MGIVTGGDSLPFRLLIASRRAEEITGHSGCIFLRHKLDDYGMNFDFTTDRGQGWRADDWFGAGALGLTSYQLLQCRHISSVIPRLIDWGLCDEGRPGQCRIVQQAPKRL